MIWFDSYYCYKSPNTKLIISFFPIDSINQFTEPKIKNQKKKKKIHSYRGWMLIGFLISLNNLKFLQR